MTGAELLRRLHAEVDAGRPVVLAGVGTGLTARSALAGGADAVIAYHSAPLRLADVPSIGGLLPLANANALVQEIAGPILRAAGDAPVLATAYAADPAVGHEELAAQLRVRGFAGVLLAPTASLVDGALRGELEAAGLGFGAELAFVPHARAAGLAACLYATNAEETRAAVAAGADVVVAHLGITVTGPRAALDDAVLRLRALAECLHDDDVLLIAHGGPLASPAAVREVVQAVPRVAGWFGASALERDPVSRAVREAAATYKATLAETNQ